MSCLASGFLALLSGAFVNEVSDEEAKAVTGTGWSSCNYAMIVAFDDGCTVGCLTTSYSSSVRTSKNPGALDNNAPCGSCTGYFADWTLCTNVP